MKCVYLLTHERCALGSNFYRNSVGFAVLISDSRWRISRFPDWAIEMKGAWRALFWWGWSLGVSKFRIVLLFWLSALLNKILNGSCLPSARSDCVSKYFLSFNVLFILCICNDFEILRLLKLIQWEYLSITYGNIRFQINLYLKYYNMMIYLLLAYLFT